MAISSRDLFHQRREALSTNVITDSVTVPRGLSDQNIRTLSQTEKDFDRYLHSLRQADLTAEIITVQPLESCIGDIRASPLYAVLRGMPKGGNMHVHENHLLGRYDLLDILWDSSDFDHLYILPEDHKRRPLEMDFFLLPPENEAWIKVKDNPLYTKEYLYERINYVGRLNLSSSPPCSFDTRRRWRESGALWSGITKVIANVNIKIKYIEAIIQTSLDDGLQYLETRKSFGDKERLYRLDPDPAYQKYNGKKYLEPDMAGVIEISMVEYAIKTAQKSRNNYALKFSGLKRLVQSVRQFDCDHVKEDIERGIALHKMYPDTIVGFDLAGEDDTGYSLYHHSQSLLIVSDYVKQTNGSFRFVCHAGETSNSGETRFRADGDEESLAVSNLVDAVILGATRIGHGLAAIKYPGIIKELAEKNIAVEIAPACNHLLGFVPDVRNHPAQVYHRSGIPIVMGSDAHGVFGTDSFTVDWYLAYVGWGLGLADLKQLAYQSLFYSCMSDKEKNVAIDHWKIAWQNYVSSMVHVVNADESHLSIA